MTPQISTSGATLDHNNLSLAALLQQIDQLRTGDAVDLINELDLDDKVALFRTLDTEQAVLLLDQPELYYADQIIDSLDNGHASRILDGMSADRATDIFHEMDPASRSRLFALLSPETKATLKKLMGYPADTAGGLMTTEFIAVPSTWSVDQTLQYIRKVERTRETVYAIYVEDKETRVLQRAVSLRRLITSDPNASISEVGKDEDPLTIPPLMDREEVARLFRKYDLLAIPVVDDHRHLIGIVTVDDVLDAMSAETSEDAYKFGGMEAFTKPYMQIGFFEMLRKRGGWLCILFLSEMLTASAMQHFEMELEKAIVLALFIPLIMSSGGNSSALMGFFQMVGGLVGGIISASMGDPVVAMATILPVMGGLSLASYMLWHRFKIPEHPIEHRIAS